MRDTAHPDWSNRKVLTVQLIILSILFFIAWLVFGFNLENYEAGVTAALNGSLTNGTPFLDESQLAHLFLMKFYAQLERILPAWHPYNICLLIGQFISIQILMYFTWLLLRPIMGGPWHTLLVQVGIFIMVDFDNIVNINLTRTAFFAAGSGLLALVYLSRLFPKYRIISILFGALLFTYGLFTRPEAGTLITIYLLAAFILLNYNLKSSLLKFSIPVLIIIALKLFSTAYLNEADNNYHKLDKAFYYDLHARRNIQPMPTKATEYDSLLYKAALSWTIGDTAHITYEYMKANVIKSSTGVLTKLISFNVYELRGYLIKYRAVLLFILLANIVLLFQPACRGMALLRLIALNALFWLMLIFVSALFKTEYRLLSPMIYFYLHTLIIFAYFHKILVPEYWNKRSKILFALTFLLSTFFISEALKDSRQYKSAQRQRENIIEELKIVAYDKYLVLDGNSLDVITPTVAFKPPVKIPFKALMLYDFGHLWLMPQYAAYLTKIASRPPEWGAMYDFLHENRDSVIYLTTLERATFMNSYLRVVHKKNYHLEPLQGEFELDKWQAYGPSLQYFTFMPNANGK